MTKLLEPNDIFAPVPASYPFEEQLEDNKARLEEQQAENTVPAPFAEQVETTSAKRTGPEPTATSEPTQTKHTKSTS